MNRVQKGIGDNIGNVTDAHEIQIRNIYPIPFKNMWENLIRIFFGTARFGLVTVYMSNIFLTKNQSLSIRKT